MKKESEKFKLSLPKFSIQIIHNLKYSYQIDVLLSFALDYFKQARGSKKLILNFKQKKFNFFSLLFVALWCLCGSLSWTAAKGKTHVE